MDFLWHKVSDKEKEQIEKDAKVIMDSFSKKLEKVSDKISEQFIEREECERLETEKEEQTDSEFRKIMFENAPEKNNDFIIAEKGGWQ